MQFGGDSSIGDLGCFALLEHLQVLLVSCLFEGGARNAFANLLVPHSQLYVAAERLVFTNFEAIHIRLKGNKVDDWANFILVLKIADYSFAGVVGETELGWVVSLNFAKVEQVLQLRHVQQLSVKVRCEELQNQRDCVCVQHAHSLTKLSFNVAYVRYMWSLLYSSSKSDLKRLIT